MKYSDIDLNIGFTRNMRQTPWTKLFPHWWSEDDLTRAIGEEIERIKAQMIFALLNMGIKPPVMLWQRSLNNKEYKEQHNITSFPDIIEIKPPKYKTWGKIIITNNGDDDIYDLNIMLDENNGLTITNTIAPDDVVVLDIETQRFSLNNHDINPFFYGEGIPYFLTSPYDNKDKKNTPLANEILRLTFNADNELDIDLNIDIILNNAVFINEQNIEITSLELLPIDKVDLYAKYDFPFRPQESGWKLVYTKEYQKETNVIYDMITTHFDTKEFYVEVFFRELEYPYKVGFPCYKDAEEDSMYHVNNRLDVWGKMLSLPRREYKTHIDEQDYPFTFPIYYPFDIEQDFWYYSRLVNEYCWNEEAINEVDLLDTNGHGIMRLHSINPFVEDFAIHAKTTQPTERENVNYNFYVPSVVTQVSQDVTIDEDDNTTTQFINIHPHRMSEHYQSKFIDTENLLNYDDNYSMITLYNKIGKYITYDLYKSQELDLFFDLSNLPEYVNIEGFEFTIDAESTDNSLDKYNDIRTRVELRSFDETIFAKSIGESGQYGLEREDIIYGGKNILFDFDEKIINKKIGNAHVLQEFIIEPFSGTFKEYVEIPFTLIENDEEINQLENVAIIYDNTRIVSADYIVEKRSYSDTKTKKTITKDVKLLRAYIPDDIEGNVITIQSLKSDSHYPFSVTFDIRQDLESNTDDSHDPIPYIEGPIVNNEIKTFTIADEWDTGDLRDILQKSGLHFIYTLQNDSETNTPTFIIHNITLKVFYSPKKTQFDLQTYIDTNTTDETSIGTLIIDIANTGSIPFNSTIDIFNEQNIGLSTNSINVNLNAYDSAQYKVQIQPQPLLTNGIYDIITFCENTKRQNTIIIDTEGLIQTTTKVKPIFTQYHDETTFEAFVNTTDRTVINEGFIEFYINKKLIGTTLVRNGQGILIKTLSDFDIETGFYNLEARYIGSDKYAPSRASSVILISKQQTEIEITSIKYGNLNTPYVCEAVVKSNGELVKDGNVTFYLNDEELGRPDVDENGIATLTHVFDDKKPCSYTLKAVYNGTITYGHSEATKDIVLSGGDTETIVYNITGAPTEKITLSAKVIQKMCAQSKYNTVNQGQMTIEIVDDDDTVLYTETLNVNNEGRISTQWTIPIDITVKDYQIICSYTDASGVFNNSKTIGTLSVQRKNVQLKHQSLFYGSRYEPLGFYIQIRDENNFAVTEGKISITIPSLNITATAQIDSDSSAKIIYNAIDFTYQEWNELDHLEFKQGEGNVFYYNGIREVEVPENLYRIYNNDYRDLQYVDFEIRDGNLYYKRQSKSDEQVYIGEDGYLYARTNIDDINMNLKQYVIGTHDVIIKYIPTEKYNSTTSNSKIKITTPQVDADLHSYYLNYNSNDLLTCFITQYDWTNHKNELVDDGTAYFYVDNVFLDKVKTQQGRAVLPTEVLSSIAANKHLLSVEYIPTNKKTHTFTYALLSLEQIPSSITYQKNRMLKGKDTHFTFTIQLPEEYRDNEQKSGYIYGNVDIFLNEERINNYYLFGDEDGVFDITVSIPDDADEKEYELLVKYEGTNFIKESSLTIPLKHTILPINTIENISIQTATNETCSINIPINASDNDDISEGYIVIYDNNKIVAKSNVIHNRALISFNIGDKAEGSYAYTIKYEDGENYENGTNNALLHVNVIKALNKIYVASYGKDNINNGSYTAPFQTLEGALNCLSDGGEIYIIDKVAITQSININKNVYINGDNQSMITKDLQNLLQTDNINNNLHIYSTTTLSDELFEIDNLTINNLNTNEFNIINKELYFLQNNELIPIYLYDNNKFYSKVPLSIQDVNSVYNITSNKKLHINNIIFNSDDNKNLNDFVLINYGELEVYHSIIQSNIAVYNYNKLTMNRNIIYGDIHEGGQYNLDNNWWGSNVVPHITNNNIILKIKADIEPPVLGEDFHVIVEMIGENGRYYDIPQLNVLLTADTGYFQTASGVFNNQQFNTLYVDAIQEGKIYATVDNETISMNVYNYDRKTEIILDDATILPIGYQVPIHAKVQSCADIFYQFDENNNIINQTNDIDNGKVIFYLNDIQIGQGYVHNGIAEMPIYFSTNNYEVNKTYKISAKYIADEYYFNSYHEKNITLITENDICFVSPDGSNDNDGTFLRPFQTITAGILSQKNTIYLKDGYYPDTNIVINSDVNIKKYNNYAIFNNHDNQDTVIFKINKENDIHVTFNGLSFINNKCKNIVNNMNNLTIVECLFYNNELQNALIDNTYAKSLKIYRSGIVNNDGIITNNTQKLQALQYCWFGTNTPDDESYKWFNDDYVINDYVIMDAVTSKNIIYIGTIARITARLKHYKHTISDDNATTYILDGALPLRIAIFESDSGLLMPLKDYTYYNQSTSLFNSNVASNSNKIFLSLPDNRNYINEPLLLKCNVTDAVGRNMEEGNITFTVTSPENKVYIFTAPVINGTATLYNDYFKLNDGTYNLQCHYKYNQETYSVSGHFIVQQPNIIIDDCQLHNITLESMQIYAENIHDSLDKKIYNQNIKIFIDNNNIYNKEHQNLFQIQNGVISDIINYKMLNSGIHTLTITTDKLHTEYAPFTYHKEFMVNKYDTHIDFKYNKIPLDYEFDLSFNILDSNNNFVLNGNIDVYFDNTRLELESNSITNGVCTIPNFKVTEKGQHSFYINYYGDDSHYHDSSYINNNINVDLYEVIIDSDELQKQLVIDSRSNLNLKFQIKDILDNIINDGYVNIYIDGLKLNDNPLLFNEEKYIQAVLNLPQNTSVGRHDCMIEYIDTENTYIDTILNTYMYITQIPVDILIQNINTEPSTNIIVPYNIQSPYGDVVTGMLTAYINNMQIGITTVTNSIANNIELYIPKLPIGNYDIIFKYTDNMGDYQETKSVKNINIIPKSINITTSHQWYYPNKDFNFIVTIKDNDGHYVDNGDVCIYIDDVKETETKPIMYGECEFILNFNQVRDYKLTVTYTDDEYYASNIYTQDFQVSSIPITDITLQEPLKSVANTEYSNTVIFHTTDNQAVYDGIIDIFLDNDKVGTFYMSDINKDFKININDLNAVQYDFKIYYHDSELFEDYIKTFNFTIEERTLNMSINNNETITAQLSEQINIPITISEPTNGIIKYYLGINEDTMKFIGVTNINGTQATYNYTLPKTIDDKPNNQAYYIIKAVFENNGKYQETIAYANLDIILTTPSLNIEPITAYYNSNINIIVTNDIEGDALLEFYLNDEYIGAEVSHNQVCTLNYTLPKKYIVGEYNLKVKYNKTSIMNEKIVNTTLTIQPSPVTIQSQKIENYIGGDIFIQAIGVDTEDRVVNEGTMSFSINDIPIIIDEQEVFNINDRIRYELPFTITDNTDIQVTYHTSNENKYQDTISYIPLVVKKHDINITANNIQQYVRGDTTDIKIILSSNTITNINTPINVQISSLDYTMEKTTMEYNNQELSFVSTLSKLLGDYTTYDLKITINDSKIFNTTEQTFKLPIHNQSKIYVDANNQDVNAIGSETNPVQTLVEAINLVSNNGEIVILSDHLVDNNITINKNINIINTNTITCPYIDEETQEQFIPTFNILEKISLSNFIFENYDDTIFINNGELNIKDSIFKNNNAQCIVNNHTLNIDNIKFTNNKSTSSGTCISIEKNNQHTTITNCSFNQNSASKQGSCINSYKGNDVYIKGNYFGENNSVQGDGTYISTYGNMSIIDNIFYPCAQSAIYILGGEIQIELNIFHNDINNVINNNANGSVIANMNYWGTNVLSEIKNKWTGIIDIDTWLLANYKLESSNIDDSSYIIGYINQYASDQEAETYEFMFNNFIHHKVDTILYKNNQQIAQKSIQEKIDLNAQTSDNIIINIFGNNIEVK